MRSTSGRIRDCRKTQMVVWKATPTGMSAHWWSSQRAQRGKAKGVEPSVTRNTLSRAEHDAGAQRPHKHRGPESRRDHARANGLSTPTVLARSASATIRWRHNPLLALPWLACRPPAASTDSAGQPRRNRLGAVPCANTMVSARRCCHRRRLSSCVVPPATRRAWVGLMRGRGAG